MREYTEAVSDLAVKSHGICYRSFPEEYLIGDRHLSLTFFAYIYVCNDPDQTPVVLIYISAPFKDIDSRYYRLSCFFI